MLVETSQADFVETRGQAVERRRGELEDYLRSVAATLPASARHRLAVYLADDPAEAIIKLAVAEQPDMIVMATHGHTGLSHLLFGHVAEQVVRSGVAPVLLVHPDAIRQAREAVGPA
jgi:nucleotide-binding universal stress UspA family protein